jgi:hypothetical protein
MFESLASWPSTSLQRFAQLATGRIRHGGHDSAIKDKEAPPVSRRGPSSNSPNYRVVMQQAAGQQAPPPQQPASPDEIVVAAVSVIIAAIKSRYFMIFSC